MVLLVVKGNKGRVDLLAASVDRALCRNCSDFLLALFLLLHPAIIEDHVQLLLPCVEFLLDLTVGADCILDPRMASNILNLQSFRRVEGNQALEEVLEGVTEEANRSFAGMGLPEDVVLLLLEDFVVGISWSCFLEWRISCIHDEENDSRCEDVHTFTLIFLARDLWSHVALSSQLCSKNSSAVLALEKGREAEVSDLEDEEMREKQILRLDVPMRVSLLMHVMEAVHHLVEVGPGNLFRELASLRNEVKELTPSNELQHDGETVVGGFIFILIGGVLSDTDQFDQILMVKLLHDAQLMLKSLKGSSLLLVFLDGDGVAMFISSQFHPKSEGRVLCMVAGSKGTDDPVLI